MQVQDKDRQLMEQLGVFDYNTAALQACEQGSQGWHAARWPRLGASEVGTVGTRDAPQTRDSLLQQRRHGPAQPTESMLRGQRHEPVLAERFVSYMQVREQRACLLRLVAVLARLERAAPPPFNLNSTLSPLHGAGACR